MEQASADVFNIFMIFGHEGLSYFYDIYNFKPTAYTFSFLLA